MNDIKSVRMRLGLTLLGALLLSAGAQASTRYYLTDLGAFSPRAINNNGDVTGALIGDAYVPAVYSHGQVSALGGSSFGYGLAINDAGQIAGSQVFSGAFQSNAFVKSGGAIKDLGSTLGGIDGLSSRANGINQAGTVVGAVGEFDLWTGDNSRAFVYRNGVMSALGSFGGPSVANAINNHGAIVGWSALTNDYYSSPHAFQYVDGVMTDLGTLGGTYSIATAINDAGQVAGRSAVPNTTGEGYPSAPAHAFLYGDGQMQDLGPLDGYSSSWALGLNSPGQVVGFSFNDGSEQRAFLYETAAWSTSTPCSSLVLAVVGSSSTPMPSMTAASSLVRPKAGEASC